MVPGNLWKRKTLMDFATHITTHCGVYPVYSTLDKNSFYATLDAARAYLEEAKSKN